MPKIVKGKSLKKYMELYGDAYMSGDLWSFSKEDVKSKAIELQEGETYWLIKGRYYETL